HHTREAQTSGGIGRSNNDIAKRSDANMHSELQDEVLHKLRVTTKGEIKYGIKIPEAMLNDKIKMPSGKSSALVVKTSGKGLMIGSGVVGDPVVIIEQLAKDDEKSMFWSINEEFQESLLNSKNTVKNQEKSRMTTLAEHIIVAGAENRPPMLEKMMLDSIDNGPLVYPTVEENWQTRPKKYSELTEAQQLLDDFDVQATNIFLHGLPPDVYAHLNHQEAAKNIWDRGETLYEYYWKFSQLINDMHTIGMIMQQVQANTKFLNALLPEWWKFVTDVKLAKSLYTTNYDLLYAYLSQHERHANEATIQDGRVTVQQFQGRKTQSFVGTGNRGIAATSRGNYAAGQTKILDEEQLAFIADPGIAEFQVVVLMANISSCDSDVLSEDTNSSAPNDLLVLYLVEQMTDHVANLDKENQTNKMVNESLTAEIERYKERVAIFEQRQNVDLHKREKLIDSQMHDLIQNKNANFTALQQETDTLKETLSNRVKEKESLSTILTAFKTECKEKESKYMDKETLLENQNKELENTLYLNTPLQEKVFSIAALKNELRKLKGKNIADTAISKPSATIVPGIFKLDIEPISQRLKNNRDAHEVYLEKTIENTDTLRGLVECAIK
nr:hypothetical protein [Tanacetum cinerariifolium]